MMVSRDDIFPIVIDEDEAGEILANAEKAAIGGRSNVRSSLDRADPDKLLEDQVVGHVLCWKQGFLWSSGRSTPQAWWSI